MKKTFIITLAAALLSLGNLAAQEKNTKTTYVIDGTKVENFDGTQLAGKYITSYVVDAEKNIHTISTASPIDANGGKGITCDRNVSDLEYDMQSSVDKINGSQTVYVVNDVVYKFKDFMELKPSDIKSMTIVKNKDSEVYKKYAKNGEASVIVATTK